MDRCDELAIPNPSLHDADSELSERRLHNAMLPIARLPIEMLLSVFDWVKFDCIFDEFNPVLLAAVCSRWMAIVFGASGAMLWCDLVVRIDSGKKTAVEAAVHRVETYVKRSRSAPLSIDLAEDDYAEFIDLRPLTDAVRSAAKRCWNLRVEGTMILRTLLPLTDVWSQLNYLHLDFMSELSDPASVFVDGTRLPALQAISISRFDSPSISCLEECFGSAPFPSCTELRLRDLVFKTAAPLALFLSRFPNLITLSLNSMEIEDPASLPSASTHILSHLIHLRVEDAPGVEALFPLLRLPLVRHVKLEMRAFSAFPVFSNLSSLVVRGSFVPALLDIVRSRSPDPSTIQYARHLTGLSEELHALAASLTGDAGSSVTLKAQTWDQKPISLHLGPWLNRYEPLDEANIARRAPEHSFCYSLQKLAEVLQTRARARPAQTRLRLFVTHRMVERAPSVAHVVSSFPGVLAIGDAFLPDQ